MQRAERTDIISTAYLRFTFFFFHVCRPRLTTRRNDNISFLNIILAYFTFHIFIPIPLYTNETILQERDFNAHTFSYTCSYPSTMCLSVKCSSTRLRQAEREIAGM